jgi:hypothetical protein
MYACATAARKNICCVAPIDIFDNYLKRKRPPLQAHRPGYSAKYRHCKT